MISSISEIIQKILCGAIDSAHTRRLLGHSPPAKDQCCVEHCQFSLTKRRSSTGARKGHQLKQRPSTRGMGQTLCTCGRALVVSNGRCYLCHGSEQQQQTRSSQDEGRERDHLAHTPPPESLTTPLKEKPRSVSAALDSAFACEEEQPDLFPSTFYRLPSRSRPRQNWSTRTPSNPPAPAENAAPCGYVRPPTTPPRSQTNARQRSYSPMSAGFARLNRREGYRETTPLSETRGRSQAARATVALEARMFEGAS